MMNAKANIVLKKHHFLLQIPSKFRYPQNSVAEGMEGPCMLLKRLADPCRDADKVPRFGRPIQVFCMVTN